MVTWLVDGLLRERHAVALFGDAVGQQHDVLVRSRSCGRILLIRLGQRGRDLRAAIGRDAGDQPLDGSAIVRLAHRHRPLEGVVEDQHADLIDGPQILHHADGGQARQFDLLPSMDDDLSMISTTAVPSGERGGASLAGSVRSSASSGCLSSPRRRCARRRSRAGRRPACTNSSSAALRGSGMVSRSQLLITIELVVVELGRECRRARARRRTDWRRACAADVLSAAGGIVRDQQHARAAQGHGVFEARLAQIAGA